VAWNLATNRWRRMTVAARHLLRQGPPEPVAGANPDRVALVGALRDLPDNQRRAVVLHYIGDLPVEQIALELGVPRCTVLSWLHRSRVRLADLLRDEAMATAAGPPPTQVVARARRRRTTRLAAMIAALLTGATAAAAVVPGVLANLPTGSNRIESVSWTSGSITLPNRTDDGTSSCPTGRRQIEDGTNYAAHIPPGYGHIRYRASGSGLTEIWIVASSAVFGDLTGDGVNEAVLRVQCGGAEFLDPGNIAVSEHLLVVARRHGRLEGLGYLGPADARVTGFEVVSGQVHARFQVPATAADGYLSSMDSPTHERVYAWAKGHLAQVDGRTQPLALRIGGRYGDVVEFAAVRKDGVTLCPAGTDFGRTTRVRAEHRRGGPGRTAVHGIEMDLDDDGNAEVLAYFSCGTVNVSINCPSLFLLGQGADRFVTLDVPLPNDGSFTFDDDLVVRGHTFSVTIRDSDTGQARRITMDWIGGRFVRL
jgi:hypothetical protein